MGFNRRDFFLFLALMQNIRDFFLALTTHMLSAVKSLHTHIAYFMYNNSITRV